MKCFCEVVELKNRDVVVTSGTAPCGGHTPVIETPCELPGADDI